MQEAQVWSLGRNDPLKNGMATHSSIPAWEIPRTEEPGRLPSMGLWRIGLNWVANANTCLVWWCLGPFMLLQMALFHSFYGSVIFYCQYVPHLLYSFIYRWTVNLFPCLAVVNYAAMNIGVLHLFDAEFCLDICPGVRLLGHMVALFLAFSRNLHTVLHSTTPIYISISCIGGFKTPFLTNRGVER